MTKKLILLLVKQPSFNELYLSILIVKLEKLQRARLLEWPIQIPDFSVNFRNDGIVGQAFADATSNLVGSGAPRLGINYLAVG